MTLVASGMGLSIARSLFRFILTSLTSNNLRSMVDRVSSQDEGCRDKLLQDFSPDQNPNLDSQSVPDRNDTSGMQIQSNQTAQSVKDWVNPPPMEAVAQGLSLCPICHQWTSSSNRYITGTVTLAWCACLTITLCPIMWVPWCLTSCKDVEEVCGECEGTKSKRTRQCCE